MRASRHAFGTCLSALVAVPVLLAVGTSAAQADDCPDADAATQAFTRGDLQSLRQMSRTATVAPCPPGFRNWIRVAVARVATAGIAGNPPADIHKAAAPPELAALQLDVPQPLVLEALGDGYRAAGHYAAAAMAYQRAMTLLADTGQSWQDFDPGPGFVRMIHQKMEEARLLSPTHVPVDLDPATQRKGGYALGSVRGFNPTVRREPIAFETDSTELTDDGEKTVSQLVERLLNENPDIVTVVGHADERGEEGYNEALSERRAAAIAEKIREAGFSGNVTAIGRGESQPFPIDGRNALPLEDQWRLDRRVEICVGLATATCGG
ncbi:MULTISPECIES: OmpA family protein [unclassified Minwuia]|jgi:outer membrane protein OmpA-like peptidoglycan-associated protein|uniref:OmpA family protein n=1 Tax=unclassified Minwuia TaxID=2618799 RepID=UPI0024788CFD|nr:MULTISPECIES: OmpA family protein [unclassified Minwuia]